MQAHTNMHTLLLDAADITICRVQGRMAAQHTWTSCTMHFSVPQTFANVAPLDGLRLLVIVAAHLWYEQGRYQHSCAQHGQVVLHTHQLFQGACDSQLVTEAAQAACVVCTMNVQPCTGATCCTSPVALLY